LTLKIKMPPTAKRGKCLLINYILNYQAIFRQVRIFQNDLTSGPLSVKL